MSNLCCIKCNKIFSTLRGLQYHINQKVCSKVKIEKTICSVCGKNFASSQSMYTHKKRYCDIKVENCEAKKEIIELKKQITKLKRINQQKVTINNTTNNTMSVQLVKFGNEDYTRLTRSEIFAALSKGYYAAQTLTELLHFNDNLLEYHNLNFNTLNGNSCSVFTGKIWETRNRKEILEKIVYDKIDIIDQISTDENYAEQYNKLKAHTQDVLKNLLSDGFNLEKTKEVQKSINTSVYDHSIHIKNSKANIQIQ